jgi:hypothetical protein
MMSAGGHGDNDLIRIDGKVDEDKSRRVEFHLRVPSFEQRNVILPRAAAPVLKAAGEDAQIELRHE